MPRDHFTDTQLETFAFLRIVFGVVWLLNTWFQAQSLLSKQFLASFSTQLAGQPNQLQDYMLSIFHGIQTVGYLPLAIAIIVIDLLIALSLLTGVGMRITIWVGIIYSFFLWSSVEGMGGPYGNGSTDPGPGIAYILAFVFLGLTNAGSRLRLFRLRKSIFKERHDEVAVGLNNLVIGRMLFGLLWAFDAYWKWQPYFITHVESYLIHGQQNQPEWIIAYIQFFISIMHGIGSIAFALIVALIETFIAISLVVGRWLEFFVPLGAVYAFGIWTTAEGWGGPYTAASTGMPDNIIGNAIIYVYIFLFLLVVYHPFRPRQPRNAIRF